MEKYKIVDENLESRIIEQNLYEGIVRRKNEEIASLKDQLVEQVKKALEELQAAHGHSNTKIILRQVGLAEQSLQSLITKAEQLKPE
jgi:hypothetical protein